MVECCMALYLFLADAVFFKRKHTHPNRRRARRLPGNRSAAPYLASALAIRKVASRLFALCMYTSDFKFGNNEPPCRLRGFCGMSCQFTMPVSGRRRRHLRCMSRQRAAALCVCPPIRRPRRPRRQPTTLKLRLLLKKTVLCVQC